MSKQMSKRNQAKKEKPDKTQKTDVSRRDFLKMAGVGVAGVAVGAIVEYPFLNSESAQLQTANQQIATLNTQLQQDSTQISSLQAQSLDSQAFFALSIKEQTLLESIVETIIPTDSNGPGAKEAGVIYFIDRQLATDYGKSGNMYMKGPFVSDGQSGPITVEGVTYPEGSPAVPYSAGTKYQYPLQLREFWRLGLEALQSYANSAYGGDFEKLTATQQVQVLTDIYSNKPTSFNEIVPVDFFNELILMTYSGFFMDPLYGGNRGQVGWKLTGFNGSNDGTFYNEGLKDTDLMVANKPTRLQPASLGQYQQKLGLSGGD